jgi:hypothetical protein
MTTKSPSISPRAARTQEPVISPATTISDPKYLFSTARTLRREPVCSFKPSTNSERTGAKSVPVKTVPLRRAAVSVGGRRASLRRSRVNSSRNERTIPTPSSICG